MAGIERSGAAVSLRGRLTCEMFSGIHDASRHTIESHAEDILFAERAGVI